MGRMTILLPTCVTMPNSQTIFNLPYKRNCGDSREKNWPLAFHLSRCTHGSIGYVIHVPISYRFRDEQRFRSKIKIFLPYNAPTKGVPLEFCDGDIALKNWYVYPRVWRYKTIECDGRAALLKQYITRSSVGCIALWRAMIMKSILESILRVSMHDNGTHSAILFYHLCPSVCLSVWPMR